MQNMKRRNYNLEVAFTKDFDRLDRTKYQSKNPIMNLLMDQFYIKLLNQISLFYDQNDDFTILDIGCGIGVIAKIISQNFPNSKITGFDYSLEAVKSAKLLLPRANINVADIYDYPLDNCSFDIVICLEVLEHLNKPEAILHYIGKVCKKHAVISIPNDRIFRASNIMRFQYLERKGNTPSHVNNWTKKTFNSLLSHHDLKIIDISTVMGFWLLFLCEKQNSEE